MWDLVLSQLDLVVMRLPFSRPAEFLLCGLVGGFLVAAVVQPAWLVRYLVRRLIRRVV